MHYYSDKSENSRLIVDRFIVTCDGSDQLFLAGAKGSEFTVLIKEYCHTKQIDPQLVVSVDPSMLDESVLGDLMVMLTRAGNSPELMVARVTPHIDAVSENRLLRFLDNPVFNDAKWIVILDGYDPFEEEIQYSNELAERSKESLFVLPPLKNRLADLASFAVDLLKSFEAERQLDAPLKLSESALDLMLAYDWPGNFEELKSVLRVLAYGSKRGGVISRDRFEEVLNLSRTTPVEV